MTEEDQIFALKTKESCVTPMAPELGLFLCECIYHAYNTRYAESHEPLALDDYADDVEAFKKSHIYPHMASTEKEEGTMEAWVRMLPLKQIRNSYEWARKKDGGRAFMSKADKREAEKRDNKKRKERDAERREREPQPPKEIILEGGLKFTGSSSSKPKGGRSGGRGRREGVHAGRGERRREGKPRVWQAGRGGRSEPGQGGRGARER